MVLAEIGGEHLRRRTEELLLDGRAHHVGDVGADRLGDRRDVGRQARRPGHGEGIGHGGGVRGQVERHRHRRHPVGEQLDQSADDPAVEAGVGHLVVADRIGSLDGDAVAVGQYGVERLEWQPGRLQRRDRPGDDANVVESASQGHFGEVARLAGVATDHGIGPDDDDESAGG